MAIALVALMTVRGAGVAALLFVIAYGAGNGLLTIARGTVPAELYGRDGLGALLGYLARAAMAARAVAPVAWPALLALGFARVGGLGLLVALAGSAGAAFAWGSRRGRVRGPASPV
jgi:hypothetical protein